MSKVSRDLEAIGWKEGYSYYYHPHACLAPGEARSEERSGEHTIPCETRRGADPDTANSLTMTVSLDEVPRDLSGLAKAFVALVRAAGRHRRKRGAPIKDDGGAIMRHLSPEARRRHGPYLKANWRRRRIIAGWDKFVAPLRRVSERTFRRDLDHYDMFMEVPGATIRDVASRCRAHGRRCDEDAVRRGVRLVYEAIHRRRFDPRKIRREANAPRVPAPEDLAAWRHFAQTIEPDWKGRLRGEVSYNEARY
jgi:hypothetical protein